MGAAPDYIALPPIEAHRKTPFSSFPLWPGNYPNLPSSWAPASALRPPL